MKNILIYGDSNSWGYDVSTYDESTGIAQRMPFTIRWPGRVQQILGSEFHIIENCLNGRTLLQEDPYFPLRSGIKGLQMALDENAPLDIVTIALGCNELKHMFNLSAGMIAFGLQALIAEAQKSHYGYPSPSILVISPHPTHPKIGEMRFGFSFGKDAYPKSTALSALYADVAKRNGCGFLDCAQLRFELNPQDGLHYSHRDHEILAKAVAEKIECMVNQHESK